MTFSILYVAFCLLFMLVALMRECLRPGLILFTAVVLLLVAGIINPEEALKGFSNKGTQIIAGFVYGSFEHCLILVSKDRVTRYPYQAVPQEFQDVDEMRFCPFFTSTSLSSASQ